MGVFKEINRADGTGVTTFYRLDNSKATVEKTEISGSGSWVDYESTLNKPSINGVTLIGDKSLDDLGIQPAGDYLTEVPEEYITEEELTAEDYASKTYVLEQINNIEHFHREIVDALPATGKTNVIYLVKKQGAGDDVYNEYIWTGVKYELLGTTAPDLTVFYTKDEANKLLSKKVDKATGKGLSTNDFTNAYKTKLDGLKNYDDTELRNKVAALHNYDDTKVKKDIKDLQDKENNLESVVATKANATDLTNKYARAVFITKTASGWKYTNAGRQTVDFAYLKAVIQENGLVSIKPVADGGPSYSTYYDISGETVTLIYCDSLGAWNKATITGSGVTITKMNQEMMWKDPVSSFNDLPHVAAIGEVRLTTDTEGIYVYDGTEWRPFDKLTSVKLSNYLSKDNILAYTPETDYNPATKKYVDDAVAQGGGGQGTGGIIIYDGEGMATKYQKILSCFNENFNLDKNVIYVKSRGTTMGVYDLLSYDTSNNQISLTFNGIFKDENNDIVSAFVTLVIDLSTSGFVTTTTEKINLLKREIAIGGETPTDPDVVLWIDKEIVGAEREQDYVTKDMLTNGSIDRIILSGGEVAKKTQIPTFRVQGTTLFIDMEG